MARRRNRMEVEIHAFLTLTLDGSKRSLTLPCYYISQQTTVLSSGDDSSQNFSRNSAANRHNWSCPGPFVRTV